MTNKTEILQKLKKVVQKIKPFKKKEEIEETEEDVLTLEELIVEEKLRLEEFNLELERNKLRLRYVGFILSKKYKYYKLMLAAKTKLAEKEGREVHGFMQWMFTDYEWLIDNDVMDLACYLAYKDYQPVLHNLIDEYDFANMNRSLVKLPEKTFFDHFRNFEFDRLVIFSDKPLRQELTWISNYRWIDNNGYETTVNYAPCNLLNMGSPLHDLPVFVLKDALGQSKLYFKAKTKSEDLTMQRDELIRKEIFKLRDKQRNAESVVEELKIESAGARKKYSDLKYKMLSRDASTTKEKFQRWEKKYDRMQTVSNVNVGKIVIGIIIVIAIIVIIIGILTSFVPNPPPPEFPETAKLLTSIFTGGG